MLRFFQRKKDRQKVRINIIDGNLIHVRSPAVVLALFDGVTPTAALKEFDHVLDNRLTDLYQQGAFNSAPGSLSFQPITNSKTKTKMLVFAGMGKFRDLGPKSLKITAENIANRFNLSGINAITTVPIGLGTGQSHEVVVSSLIGGFLKAMRDSGRKNIIRTINICDLSPINCRELKEECLKFARKEFGRAFDISVIRKSVSSDGRLSNMSPQPIHIMVELKPCEENPEDDVVVESLCIGVQNAAAGKPYSQKINRQDLNGKIDELIQNNNHEAAQGEEMLKFLLGEEIVENIDQEIKDSPKPIKIIHDYGASVIPWEVMSLPISMFPATNVPFSRFFIADPERQTPLASKKKWSPNRKRAKSLNLLLVVNPTEDLPGAEVEGQAINEALSEKGAIEVKKVEGQDATKDMVLQELGSGKYDVFHFAGHAQFDEFDSSNTGLICYGDQVLNGMDIQEKVSTLPPVMFLNACESALINEADNHYPLAHREVGLAEAFLNSGVLQFIGTYWPVNDGSAKIFAERLYTMLLERHTIGEAIYIARQAVWRKDKKNWANYVHFGDAGFTVKDS